MALYHYAVKCQKWLKFGVLPPILSQKKAKNGGFLRVCGRKMVGGAVKMPKNPPGGLL